jgi:inosine-uridine nucleoside N-ribohydrolase
VSWWAAALVLIVEADNALGSAHGDVDDGFALAALLGASERELVVVSTFGNTNEAAADRNNRALAALSGRTVTHLRGCAHAGEDHAEAVDFLCRAGAGAVLLALGPLTTLAAALRRQLGLALARVVVVGGDLTSRGRWPPLWPHEFNLCKDRAAASAVFASRLPLTIVPLDVGRRLLLPPAFLARLQGDVGAHLRVHADRRLQRNRRWLGLDALRSYDVLAAATQFAPEALRCEVRRVRLHHRGFLEQGKGRDADVVVDFDADAVLAAVGERINALALARDQSDA